MPSADAIASSSVLSFIHAFGDWWHFLGASQLRCSGVKVGEG